MNNNRDTIRDWLVEQLEIVEGQGEQLAILGLVLIAAGNEKTIFEMKSGGPKWGDADHMADVIWTQASRTAKGLPGFIQFQLEASFGTGQGLKPTRFLPFGIMGATQLGPAAGGTAFGGLATEAPTPFGQASQGMRLTEMLVQGAFNLITHVTNVLQKENERKDHRIEVMEKRLDEQWLALKTALLEIQNSAMSQAMKALQMEAVKKLITLAPGLVNMMAGRDIFPPSAVDASLIEAMAANLTPEEQQAAIAWLNSNPNGQPVAAVLADQLGKHKKRKEHTDAEMARAASGLPIRGYDDALADAGGTIMRVLRGEESHAALPENGAAKKIVAASANGNGHAASEPAAPPKNEPIATGSADGEIIEEILSKTDRAQIPMLAPLLGQALVDKLLKRYDELAAAGRIT